MNNTISLEQAITMTTSYRDQKDVILKPEFLGKNILSLSETFDRAVFDTILLQADCTGVRIYFGMNTEMQLRSIIVGVNSKNEDILPTAVAVRTALETNGSLEGGPGGTIGEDGNVCPPLCPPASPLNP